MNKQLLEYQEKIHAMTLRERAMILISVLAVLVFIWWTFFTEALLNKTDQLSKQNLVLEQEIETLNLTADGINRRMQQGVNNTKQQQLELLSAELKTVNDILRQMTLELIEPDEMFGLMQQLVFADSKLELTGLKRKQMAPVFEVEEEDQPGIFRHVMQMGFKGSYQDIVNYISRLEQTEWKLIWDRIRLKTNNYPTIEVDIEISTLSDDQHWVGL